MTENDGAIKNLINSTIVVGFTRLVLPVILSIIGFFMVQTLADVRTGITDLTRSVNGQSVDIAVLKTRMDAAARTLDKLNDNPQRH